MVRQHTHASLKRTRTTRKRMEGTLTILQGEELIHWTTTTLCTNLFLRLKQWTYQMRKLRWIQKGKTIPAWQLTKVRSKKEVIDEAGKEDNTTHFASLMDICHRSCTPRWHCETWFKILRSIYRARIISFTNDRSKSNGYHLKIARLRWTSSRRSISLYPSENGRCSQIVQNSKNRNVQTFGFVYHDTYGQIMVQYSRPSRSSWAKSVWSSFGRTIMGKAIWESSTRTLWKSSKLGMFIR